MSLGSQAGVKDQGCRRGSGSWLVKDQASSRGVESELHVKLAPRAISLSAANAALRLRVRARSWFTPHPH